jgi:O-antigen/teichoic acid export membrane protein
MSSTAKAGKNLFLKPNLHETFIYIDADLLMGIIIIPGSVYEMIFGKAFRGTKEIMLLYLPGILAIAVSDMIGYYFSGIKELKILNIKSIVGLVITVAFSFLLIPKYGILGACIVTTLSYSVSALLLFLKFYRSTDFSIRDYMITKEDVRLAKENLMKK